MGERVLGGAGVITLGLGGKAACLTVQEQPRRR